LGTGLNDNQLARDAEAGVCAAQYEHGLALLGKERAEREGMRGIALIESAAQQGHPEALALSAVFEAMGAARPQNWEGALDRLHQAAEAGSTAARGQLAVLGERGTEEGAASYEGDWSTVRKKLSVERLLAPPPRDKLSGAPLIAAFRGFASGPECDWAVMRARSRLERAAVFHSKSGGQTYASVRDNSGFGFDLPDMDLVLEVLRARMARAIRIPAPAFEPTQVLHYAVGEQFKPHHDFLDPQSAGFEDQLRLFGQRVATVLIYLNDGYKGGETLFPKVGISFRGQKGDALFFANVDRNGQADPLTMHAGAPPTSGEKWVISQWVRDRLPQPPGAKQAGARSDA